ncbi:hypothetical protein EBZ80_22580 [bacterium]|jgi:hypothetical protein|nr:hypothetical protein [bacterium]
MTNAAKRFRSRAISGHHASAVTVTLACGLGAAEQAHGFNLIEFATGQLQTTGELLTGKSRLRFSPGTQDQFESLASDVMAAMEPKAISSTATAEGQGLSVSLAYDKTSTEDPNPWQLATGDTRSEFRVPRIGLRYRWSDALAVGASALYLPNIQLTLYSVEGALSTPQDFGPIRVGLYASYNKLEGFRGSEANTLSAGITGSTRIMSLSITGGAGVVHGHASYNGTSDFSAIINQSRLFAAVVYPVRDFSVGAEIGVIGQRNYQSIGISYRF